MFKRIGAGFLGDVQSYKKFLIYFDIVVCLSVCYNVKSKNAN